MVLKNLRVLKRELMKVLVCFYENYITKAYREVEVSECIRDLDTGFEVSGRTSCPGRAGECAPRIL
jgi:hypothetical protein